MDFWVQTVKHQCLHLEILSSGFVTIFLLLRANLIFLSSFPYLYKPLTHGVLRESDDGLLLHALQEEPSPLLTSGPGVGGQAEYARQGTCLHRLWTEPADAHVRPAVKAGHDGTGHAGSGSRQDFRLVLRSRTRLRDLLLGELEGTGRGTQGWKLITGRAGGNRQGRRGLHIRDFARAPRPSSSAASSACTAPPNLSPRPMSPRPPVRALPGVPGSGSRLWT